MDVEAYFFWVGLTLLFSVALVLRHLEASRLAASVARGTSVAEAANAEIATMPAKREKVRVIRRGGIEVWVWAGGGRGGAPRHMMTVDRNGRDWRDCETCINEAMLWIEQRQLSA